MRAEWMEQAACRDADPRIFDLDVAKDDTTAKLYCFDCPVRSECLQIALERNEVGVWGATTDKYRTSLRRRLGVSTIRQQGSISHGTTAGARAHYRRGEKPCRDCLDAQRLANGGRHGFRRESAS